MRVHTSRPLAGGDRRVGQPRRIPLPTPSGVAAAFEALDLVVVIDVALTDTARHGHYSGAASRYEKPQGTYFNFEFADHTFWLRHPLIEPLPGHCPRWTSRPG